ncbi:MAG: glutathione synthase [Proteobacteria bacterium]|nr:glutathione synthase [Pseudomonadota bacterium]
MKYNAEYKLTHAPIALVPYPISRKTLERMIALTPLSNRLMLKVGQDREFLREQLEILTGSDDFVGNLLARISKGQTPPLELLISRNDFLPAATSPSLADFHPQQVEFNTISNSFAFLSRQVCQLHRYLYSNDSPESKPIANDPLEKTVEAMAEAIRHYDYPGSCMLMVVQSREQNLFDQRAIEYRLFEKAEVPTIRMSLEEISEDGVLKDGHLVLKGRVVSLCYFRAGYTPDDYPTPQAWKGRELIEASSSVKAPSIGMQLAGAKKIQQALCKPEILRRYLSTKEIDQIKDTFVGLYTLDELVDGRPADRMAYESPSGYVLKPQREGGGNNLYDGEMLEKLRSMTAEQRHAYILMERITAPSQPAILVVDGTSTETACVSEIGRYGVCFFNGEDIAFNRDAGYLVRTKAADQNEGGVCAGYACLNSLRLV